MDMPDEFWRNTWHHWLPLGPWMMLAMTVGTATRYDIDGSLQDLVDTVTGSENADLPRCGPLDGPLRWNDSEDPEEIAEADRTRQALAEVLDRAGHPVPQSARQLAHLLVDLGVLSHAHSPERWRLVLPMPAVAETLPIPDSAREREREIRDYWDFKGAHQAILRWANTHVPDEETIGEAFTSLRSLASDCGMSVHETRRGLALTAMEEDVAIMRHDRELDRDQILALQEHHRFWLRMDWKAHAENRMVIQAGPEEEDEPARS